MHKTILRLAAMRTLALGLAIAAMSGCQLPGSSTPETPIELSAEAKAEYWRQFERRVGVWFKGNPPPLPSADEVFARVHFVEVPHAYLSTCTFSPGSFQIRIGDDKWQSGCVAHEIGHAALRMIGHPCSSIFEHQGGGNPAPDRCL